MSRHYFLSSALSLVRSPAPVVRRSFHPLFAGIPALAKLLVVKKVGFWGGLQAANAYGWPRITRRLLKFNKLHTPPEAQRRVQAGVMQAIRTPSEAYSVLKDSEVYRFVDKVARDGASHVPGWVQSLANSVASKTSVYKALKELENEAKRISQLKRARDRADAGEAAACELKQQMQEMEAEKQKTEAKLQEALEALAQTQENKGGR